MVIVPKRVRGDRDPFGNRRLPFLEPDIPFATRLPPWLRRFAMSREQQKRPSAAYTRSGALHPRIKRGGSWPDPEFAADQDDDAIGVGERVTDREEAGLR